MASYVFILTIVWPDDKRTVRRVSNPLEVDRILYDNLANGCIVTIERIEE